MFELVFWSIAMLICGFVLGWLVRGAAGPDTLDAPRPPVPDDGGRRRRPLA